MVKIFMHACIIEMCTFNYNCQNIIDVCFSFQYFKNLFTLNGPLLVLSPSLTVTPGANSMHSI
jgi:hypothetical protein